jgi:hypothetical protein
MVVMVPVGILLQEAARFLFPTFLLWNSSRGKDGTVQAKEDRVPPELRDGALILVGREDETVLWLVQGIDQ